MLLNFSTLNPHLFFTLSSLSLFCPFSLEAGISAPLPACQSLCCDFCLVCLPPWTCSLAQKETGDRLMALLWNHSHIASRQPPPPLVLHLLHHENKSPVSHLLLLYNIHCQIFILIFTQVENTEEREFYMGVHRPMKWLPVGGQLEDSYSTKQSFKLNTFM